MVALGMPWPTLVTSVEMDLMVKLIVLFRECFGGRGVVEGVVK